VNKLEFLKWSGTACVVASAAARGLGFNTTDIVLSLIGAGLWAVAAVIMKERALWTVNGFIIVILIGGLLLR
jgi:hypothetical protein